MLSINSAHVSHRSKINGIDLHYDYSLKRGMEYRTLFFISMTQKAKLTWTWFGLCVALSHALPYNLYQHCSALVEVGGKARMKP